MSAHLLHSHSVQVGVRYSTVFPFYRSRKHSEWYKGIPITPIDYHGARYRKLYAIWNASLSPSPFSPSSGSSSAENFKHIELIDSTSEQVFNEQNQLGTVWTATEIAETTGGQVIKPGLPGSICTDTRTLKPGQWFLPLTGPRFDGHDFIQSALAKSCAGVVGNRVCENWPRGFVHVEENTLTILQKLGSSARKKFKDPVVGITGSAGKTTTRAMVALALESLGHIHQTSGNQNNHIGVPLTLISMPLPSKACVLELGMNHAGEIEELARISEPCVRVVLNVGPAHMENFTSLDEIGRAKGEIFLGARPGDICILNADDPLVMALRVPDGVQRVLFGSKSGCNMQLIAAKCIQGGHAIQVTLEHFSPAKVEREKDSLQYKNSVTSFRDIEGAECCEQSNSRVVFEIPAPGLHLGMNACAAAAVAVSLGISLTQVGESLSKFTPVNMRLCMETFENGITVINDTYNANPISMVAALELLHSIECKGRKVALLGDMLELGTYSKKAHADIVKICHQRGIQHLGVAGLHFTEAVNVVNMVSTESCTLSAPDSESLALKIRNDLNKGDVVLVKGSRGMRMEIVVEAIKKI